LSEIALESVGGLGTLDLQDVRKSCQRPHFLFLSAMRDGIDASVWIGGGFGALPSMWRAHSVSTRSCGNGWGSLPSSAGSGGSRALGGKTSCRPATADPKAADGAP